MKVKVFIGLSRSPEKRRSSWALGGGRRGVAPLAKSVPAKTAMKRSSFIPFWARVAGNQQARSCNRSCTEWSQRSETLKWLAIFPKGKPCRTKPLRLTENSPHATKRAMNSPALARRYARAALNAAGSASVNLYAHAAALLEALTEGNLAEQLSNPRLGRKERQQLATTLSSNGLEKILANTINLLARNNRLALLPDVLSALAQLQDESAGRTRVRVETAVPLTTAQESTLAQLVKKEVGSKEVVVEQTVTPQLLGGFRAFFGGKVWDASLSGTFRRLKDHLAHTPHIQ